MGRVLELAMGLGFVYLLLASMVSAISEIAAWVTSRRSKSLREGVITMLQDPTLQAEIYKHSLISSLNAGKDPSYIPTRIFVAALLHEVGQRGAGANLTDKLEELRMGISKLPDAPKAALSALLDNGVKTMADAQEAIGHWFDASMDRLSGAYKRNTQLLAVGLALVVSLGFNADSVRITESLWTDPALRAELVRQAAAAMPKLSPTGTAVPPPVGALGGDNTTRAPANVAGSEPGSVTESAAELRALTDQMGGLGLPLGWTNWTRPTGGWVTLRWLLGLLATVLAVSLGAPFWFDTLNRIANIRAVGPKPTKP